MSDVHEKTLKVPGATIYSEVRGQGPLLFLIPGGASDTDTLSRLAVLMSSHYTVVSYDPRGVSRSVFDERPVLQDLDVHGDDLAALVQSFTTESVLIFGNSGGAQIGLNFTARFPFLAKRLVAHEPPCLSLLPDARDIFDQMQNVEDIFRRQGTMEAMTEFLRVGGLPAPAKPLGQKLPPTRVLDNMRYFLEFGLKPIGTYKPDISKLKQSDVVIAAGRESSGQLAFRTAQALARQLERELVLFPEGHSSWAKKPDAFAQSLLAALENGL